MTKPFDITGRRIWVAGHKGMVGSALVRRLEGEDCEVITADRHTLDLTRQEEVEAWMEANQPDVVFLAAAKVGGIHANNSYPAEFLYQNLAVQTHVIHTAYRIGVSKLVFLGSSCIYPKHAPQPIPEESLNTGPLEPTNQWYAIAKIAGLMMCQAYRRQYGCDFISVMPTNLYGPGDNYDLDNSHVVAALMVKAHQAKERGDKELVIWGSGKPLREFMYVDDFADALVFLARNYSEDEIINAGSGQEISIKELAALWSKVVGFEGKYTFDPTKPDGTPRKLMNSDRLKALGWKPRYTLETGFTHTYQSYLSNLR